MAMSIYSVNYKDVYGERMKSTNDSMDFQLSVIVVDDHDGLYHFGHRNNVRIL